MFWQGTKGISKQTFKSLSALLTGQRLQRYRQQPDLQNQRDNLAREVIRRVKSLQNSQGKLTPSTLKQGKQMCYLSCLHTTHTHTSILSAFKFHLVATILNQDQTFLYICFRGKEKFNHSEGKKPPIQGGLKVVHSEGQEPAATSTYSNTHPTLQCTSE